MIDKCFIQNLKDTTIKIYFTQWLAFFIMLFLSAILNDIFLSYLAIIYIIIYHIIVIYIAHSYEN